MTEALRAFERWLDLRRPERFGFEGSEWTADALVEEIRDCADPLPGPYCVELDMAAGTSYGEAARALRLAVAIPAPSDPNRLRPKLKRVDGDRVTIGVSKATLGRMLEGQPLYVDRRQARRLGLDKEPVVRLEDS